VTDEVLTDEEFFENYEEIKPIVMKLAHNFSRGDVSLVGDLEQEALIKMWRYKHRFQPGTNFATWSYVVARNAMINYHNKERRIREELEDYRVGFVEPVMDRPDEIYEKHESHRELMQILEDRLIPQYRDALICVDLQGLSYLETADRLGVPVGTVMSRLFRARAQLNISPRS
jgi:RNA polymerase sigma-70 factor, ECF subfamily